MNKIEKTKIINILPDLDIRMVLKLFGADFINSRYRVTSDFVDNAALEIKTGDALPEGKNNAFLCKNEYWKDYKTAVSGRGAFSFLKFLLGIEKSDFNRNDEVYQFIKDNFLDEDFQIKKDIQTQVSSYKGLGTKKKVDFNPPEREDDILQEGIDYLVKQRGIPFDVIQKNMNNEQGTIYVATMYGWDKNVIFKSYSNGERRSIYGSDKKSVEGSNRDLSGYEVVGEPLLFELETTINEDGEEEQFIKKGTGRFAITEAAIDALSYRALYPDSFAVSLNGVGNFQLAYKKAIGYIASDMGISIRVAFDNDMAGDKGAQKLFNAIYLRLLFNKKFEPILKKHFSYLNNEEDPEGWKKGVDSWLLEDKITFKTEFSPHLMFYNNPFFQQKYPVHHEKVEKGKTVIIDTGELKHPTISFYVVDEIASLLNIKQNNEIKVQPQSYYKLTSEILVRERPLVYHDWNDALKAQGIKYIDRYEELVSKNFIENGVKVFPELDDGKSPLSMFRERNPFLKEEHKKIFAKYYDNSYPFNGDTYDVEEGKTVNNEVVSEVVNVKTQQIIVNRLSNASLEDLKKFVKEKDQKFNSKIIELHKKEIEQNQQKLKQEIEAELKKQKEQENKTQQLLLNQPKTGTGDFISNAKQKMFKGMSKDFVEKTVKKEQFNDYSNGNGTVDVEGYLFEDNHGEFDSNNDLFYYGEQNLNNDPISEEIPVELYQEDYGFEEQNQEQANLNKKYKL